MNALPAGLKRRCEEYETPANLSLIFVEKKAVFHKTCISSYNKQKLTRKRKLDDSIDNCESFTEPSVESIHGDEGISKRTT